MVAKAEIFFVRNLIPFSAGILLVSDIKSIVWLNFLQLLVWSVFTILLIANLLYKKYSLNRFKGIFGLINYVFWLAFGSFICLLNRDIVNESRLHLGEKTFFKGWVASEPQVKNGLARMEVNITNILDSSSGKSIHTKLLLSVKLDPHVNVALNYGDELIIAGKCQTVDGPQNPGEFDFKSWLRSKNILYQIYTDQENIVKVATDWGNPLVKYALSLRKEAVGLYRKLIKDDQAFAVASTLVLGYRSDLSRETLSSYSKTGTMHALSVSGAHVGIIYLLLNWIFFFLTRHKIWKLAIICAILWWYALLTGFSPSVLRSAIMLSIFLVAKTFSKETNSYNTLAFTAFLLLVYEPLLIWDVGFQLSFLAVLGLIFIQPKIYSLFTFNNKLLDLIWSAVAMSLAAQFTTFPHSIYYFHQFPLYFVFSNLFILLPLSAMMYLGIAVLMVKAYFLAPIFEWIIVFTNNGLRWIAELPLAGITGIWLDRWQLALLLATLCSLTLALVYRKKKLLYTGLMLLFTFQCFTLKNKIEALEQQKILFFSLRRHYAVAFIDGIQATLITDLSPKDPAFEFSLKPALDQLRIERFDVVNWEADTTVGHLIKSKHQINFHNFSILLLNPHFDHRRVINLPTFDIVWIHDNPKRKLDDLRTQVVFKSLAVDATNPDYAVKSYQEQADKIAVTLHLLKKNTSYLVDLKLKYNE